MKSKVLIATIPVQDITRPPGILSILAGCCETAGCDYTLLDLNLFMYKKLPHEIVTHLTTDLGINKFRSKEIEKEYAGVCDHFIEQIQIYRPTHIAISIFTYMSILSANYLLKRLKDANLDLNYKIILGGLGLSDRVDSITGLQTFGEYCLDQNLSDYCIYGEGELAFIELLKNNTSYPGINNREEKQLLDLDNLPLPSYEKINPRDYFYSDAPEVLLTGSRGCVRDCSFCDVGRYWPKYIFKSGQRIAEEVLITWKATGVQKFEFSDSLINGSLKSLRGFVKKIIEYKSIYPQFNPRFKGQFICRPKNEMKEKDYIDMVDAGLETIVVGIESFSDSVRTHMRKKFSNEDIDYHFELCAKLGIKNDLLILTGYVNETLEDHNKNIEYLKKFQAYALSRIIYVINIQISGLVITKGTPLYNMLHDLEIVFPNYNNEQVGEDWISLKNPSLTAKERLRRGIEIVSLAYELGYKVISFNQKVDYAEQTYHSLINNKEKKIFKIAPISILS